MTILKTGLLILITFFLLTNCGKPISDTDFKESITGILEVYKGFFKVLEEKKTDPDSALAAGEKFVEDSKAKLQAFGRTFSGKVTSEQRKMLDQFTAELKAISAEANQKLGPEFMAKPGVPTKLQNLMLKLGSHYADAASGEKGSTNKAAIEMIKKSLLETADKKKDTPIQERQKILDEWVLSVAQLGADKAEQDAFRDELKKKLGW